MIFFGRPFAAAASAISCEWHALSKLENKNAASSTVRPTVNNLETASAYPTHPNTPGEQRTDVPMILQDARNAILTKRRSNLPTLILRQRNAAMVVVHAQLSVEVARIYQRQLYPDFRE
jgi:hypothetical protein